MIFYNDRNGVWTVFKDFFFLQAGQLFSKIHHFHWADALSDKVHTVKDGKKKDAPDNHGDQELGERACRYISLTSIHIINGKPQKVTSGMVSR